MLYQWKEILHKVRFSIYLTTWVAVLTFSKQVFAMTGGSCLGGQDRCHQKSPQKHTVTLEKSVNEINSEIELNVPLKGEDIFHRTYGSPSQDALVLIHGLGADNRTFRDVAHALSHRFYVITYDQRGHGRTKALGLDYSPELLARDLKVLLDYLNVKQAHFLGHSFGARTAMKFSELYPEFVQTMIVEDMDMLSRWGSSPDVRRVFIQRARERRAQNMPYVDDLYNYYSNSSDLTTSLKAVLFPILFLRADPQGQGSGMSEEGIKQIQELVSNAKMITLHEAYHDIHNSQPFAFISSVLEFIETNSKR